MKSPEAWTPTKFVATPGGLRASRDARYVGLGSRLVTDLLAPVYERALRTFARGVLVDLGCARAPLYGVYHALVQDVVCIDRAEPAEGPCHLDGVADLERGIPLPDGTADTVLLTDVLMYVARPERLFGEIVRVLRPGGRAIVGAPFLYWVVDEHDRHRHTGTELRRLCEQAGLAVESQETYGGAPEVLSDLVAKLLAPRPRVARVFLAAAERLLAHRRVRALSHNTRAGFPLGYCTVARKPAPGGAA
ncbi:MAG TPA: methyltransferase domain-containing protein [Myxococcota bacterium]|nr:methyltransferase domain-containing protein [Myxococcota bacterium]